MNFQNLNFDFVEQNHLPPHPRYYPAGGPRTPSNPSDGSPHDPGADHASSRAASPSSRQTVVPYRRTSFTTSTSTPEVYGPDRLFGPPLIPPPPATVSPPSSPTSASPSPPSPETPETRIATNAHAEAMARKAELDGRMNAAMLTQFRDDLVREAGVVTPGVDETPYLQYAIEALTRDRERSTGYSGSGSSSTNSAPLPAPHVVPDRGLGYYRPPEAAVGQRQQQQQQRPAELHSYPGRRNSAARPLRPLESLTEEDPRPRAPLSNAETLRPGEWTPVGEDAIVERIGLEKAGAYPPLDFLPWILRPLSFATLMLLCLLMIAALVTCAVTSQLGHGLAPYAGSIHGGQYFVFRILPQLLAAIILVYAQCVVAATLRIRPFVRLASDHADDRDDALFQDLYPRTFLWPRLVGGWSTWLPILVTWLAALTLPLQSALFTVVRVGGVWTWGAVQGVVWTLVALYAALLASMAVAMLSWSRVAETGLLWDPRSLADIAVLLSDTNTAADYRGTQLAGSRARLRFALRRRRADRLGYWAWRDGRPGLWYALGSSRENADSSGFPYHERLGSSDASREKAAAVAASHRDAEAAALRPDVRYRYLPWCLRTGPLATFAAVFLALLVALLVAAFLPSTRLANGFLPRLPAVPGPGAFSPADFLYSFLPSLLGLLLYLAFQTLELSLRVLQPWAALGTGDGDGRGAPANASVLADYAAGACVPLRGVVRAARCGHWRLVAVACLSPLFLFLPILGGGAFMALTTPRDGLVRVFANGPAAALVLALLLLYLATLVLLLLAPGSSSSPSSGRRSPWRLPHAVTCLAEIISFLANEDLLDDPALKGCRSRDELMARLLGSSERDDGRAAARWAFGVTPADRTLGVSRARRFTERKRVRKSQIRLGRADEVA